MSAELDSIQKRLEDHFAAVAAARSGRGLPVFAFEHGLGTDELSEVSTLLKAALRTNYRLAKHWLVWVVYATEQGYDYDGDEYWHTFERRMPLWDRGWRPALRGWFGKFHRTYAGLVPVGRWANFFSIIAWPITHALLPKDLQGQLARALYGLRYHIVSRLDQSPADVGRYLARMARGGSSRFDNFLEQEELVGRIVLGLLDHRTADGDGAILPQALARIVGDLEKARNARQWLHDTRKAVESARIRGVARNAPGHIASVLTAGGGQTERRPSIRPSLSLRRTAVEEWTLIVELPGLQQVADLSPDLGDFLSRTRCSVAGASGLRPPGWLLEGAQRRALDAWPPTDEPVLRFQVPNPRMDHLLASEGHISQGPHWLFRVGSDGEATEVIGRMVRPGMSYVLVSQSDLPNVSFAAPTSLRCRGAQAIRFEVPQALSAEQVGELKAAGLSVAQTIRVWPVGLAARGWDGVLDADHEPVAAWSGHRVPRIRVEVEGVVPRLVRRLLPGVDENDPRQQLRGGGAGDAEDLLSVGAELHEGPSGERPHEVFGVVREVGRQPPPAQPRVDHEHQDERLPPDELLRVPEHIVGVVLREFVWVGEVRGELHAALRFEPDIQRATRGPTRVGEFGDERPEAGAEQIGHRAHADVDASAYGDEDVGELARQLPAELSREVFVQAERLGVEVDRRRDAEHPVEVGTVGVEDRGGQVAPPSASRRCHSILRSS